MSDHDDVLDGLYPGVVTSSADPLKMGRVKISYPWLDDEAESYWARVIQPYAGNERGMFFMPEVGDEVVVVFEMGDFHQPMVVGGTWNGKDEPPEPGDPDGSNHHKIIETRSGHKLHFCDEPGAEFIQLNDSSLNNIVRWDTAADSLTITAKTGDIYIKAPTGKISLLAKDIVMVVSDTAKRTVGGNEKTTVAKAAAEVEGTSKTWTASTSLTNTSKVVALSASGSMSMSGGSASVATTQSNEDKIVVAGPTTDTVGKLEMEADHIYEKADVRTITAGAITFKAPSVVMDASAAFTLTAAALTIKGKGQLSLLGNMINIMAPAIIMKAGQISWNPKNPIPPGPGVPSQLMMEAGRAASAMV